MTTTNFNVEEATIVAEKTSNPVWADEELPIKYYTAFYSGKAVMEEFFVEQQKMVEELLDEGDRSNSSLVDVGCGTCEVGSQLFSTVKYSVNCDFNPVFFRLTFELHPQCLEATNFHCLLGDAQELSALLEANPSLSNDEFKQTRKVCTTLTNTFGILPEPIRVPIIKEMVRAAGPDGASVIACFHSGSFRRGIEEFYKQTPEMCGTITDEMCDFDNAVFLNPDTGYTSQWWSEERLRNQLQSIEGVDVEVKVRGPGIFYILRQSKE